MTVSDGEFQALFEREYPRLVRVLSRADDDAADAVQEAFIQAFVRWGRVSRLEDPTGWVRRVAVNRLLNAERSRARGRGAVSVLASRQSRDATTVDSDARLDIRTAVRQLAPQQRVAVALFYGGDLSVAEVADAMKVTKGTVKSHLHAARERLRELVEDASRG